MLTDPNRKLAVRFAYCQDEPAAFWRIDLRSVFLTASIGLPVHSHLARGLAAPASEPERAAKPPFSQFRRTAAYRGRPGCPWPDPPTAEGGSRVYRDW
jgi:hypothetical protein